ncbi:MAG TPA: 1-acyl-sn-glycerol-3-phosphate acyltransferase, partial [Rhizomicrobium sp.]|nr:1-acyl-sn-glycerol-3-phosphate acyltransferase [Rhizomicrobium sp.]
RTRLGKYRRFLLPAIYERAQARARHEVAAELSAEDKALLEKPAARRVYDMLVARYSRGPLSLDASPLLDLGIDSLEWISFGLELEDRLNLHLSEAEIGGIVTVRDLLRLAARGSAAPPVPSRDWTAPTGIVLEFLGGLLYGLDDLIMRVLFRLHAKGGEYLPSGNFILIANHASYLDAPTIGATLPWRVLRQCYWAGDPAILFVKRWQAPFMRALHCFPADERTPAQTLAASENLLKRGDSIIWFPEGWRTPDGALQAFLPGIGHLLQRVPVPVVPAWIDGTFEAWPRDRRFPKLRPVRIKFGRPIYPADWQAVAANSKNAPQAIADFLRGVVENLKVS